MTKQEQQELVDLRHLIRPSWADKAADLIETLTRERDEVRRALVVINELLAAISARTPGGEG